MIKAEDSDEETIMLNSMLVFINTMVLMFIASDYKYNPVNFLGLNICVLGSLIYTKVKNSAFLSFAITTNRAFIVFFFVFFR